MPLNTLNPVDATGAQHDRELRRLNDEYVRASLNQDVEWFREHLADDFVCIESDGSVYFKDAFLRLTAKGSNVATYRLDYVNLRFYGTVALVQASGSWTTRTGDAGISRYIDVYAYANGAWKVVSAQVTRPAFAA